MLFSPFAHDAEGHLCARATGCLAVSSAGFHTCNPRPARAAGDLQTKYRGARRSATLPAQTNAGTVGPAALESATLGPEGSGLMQPFARTDTTLHLWRLFRLATCQPGGSDSDLVRSVLFHRYGRVVCDRSIPVTVHPSRYPFTDHNIPGPARLVLIHIQTAICLARNSTSCRGLAEQPEGC